MNNIENAKILVKAIREIATKEENLDNIECYLSHHFDVWMQKFANNPDNLTSELKHFAEMDIKLN